MQFQIDDMTCGSCVRHVTRAIQSVDPAATVEADTVARQITVSTSAESSAILEALAIDGYPARLI